MANSPSFVTHAVDLLSLAGPVLARRMFGGHGLYHRGAMFALLDDDELYLKADELTRQDFLEAGCSPWVYESPRGPMETSYYRPPDDAHEDAEAMLPWARLAIGAAQRAAAAKAARAAARSARAGAKAKGVVRKRTARKAKVGKRKGGRR
jgi:DNA transformation protein